MKRIFLRLSVFIVPCIVLFLSGCQTLKGVGTIGAGLGMTVAGVVEDGKNVWDTLEKADKWFEENYW